MKNLRSAKALRGGYTLAELSVSTAVCCVAFLAMITAWITLQRSYLAVNQYCENSTAQLRALDYIARDARSAQTTTVSSGTLTLTLPDYYTSYDSQGNPIGAPVNPTISGSTLTYNSWAQPVTIQYSVSGGALTRKVTISRTGATSTGIVCSGVANLGAQFVDATGYVAITLSFTPQFRGAGKPVAPPATLATNVYLRNLQH